MVETLGKCVQDMWVKKSNLCQDIHHDKDIGLNVPKVCELRNSTHVKISATIETLGKCAWGVWVSKSNLC